MKKNLADTLAFVEITDSKRNLQARSRLAILDLVNMEFCVGGRSYVLTDEARGMLQDSNLWKAHQKLLSMGFVFSRRLRAKPGFISYEHVEPSRTKSGREFHRTAFISGGKGCRYRIYAEQPDETNASGWATRGIDQ